MAFLIGENGTGKSTLIEAIAGAAGFNAEGGSQNFNFATRHTDSDLHASLRLVRSPRRQRTGFFLRAESLYNLATSHSANSRCWRSSTIMCSGAARNSSWPRIRRTKIPSTSSSHAISSTIGNRSSASFFQMPGSRPDPDQVTAWMTGYREAWTSNDSDENGQLLTEHALYYTEPFSTPWRGRQAIVDNWLARKDEPGQTQFA